VLRAAASLTLLQIAPPLTALTAAYQQHGMPVNVQQRSVDSMDPLID
jgi:hypothetical protein